MSERDAIKYIEQHGFIADDVKDMAIKAIERQIPKEICYREQSYGTPWICPECEADQVKVEFFCEDGSKPKENYTYCWCCGQRLDWGE